MQANELRNWLGLYFLIITGILGTYILLFGETRLLPIAKSEANDCFQIIIPMLVGQITLIFQWFTGEYKDDRAIVPLPTWVVKAPPIMVAVILIVSIISLIVSNFADGRSAWLDPASFKAIVTFCVSLLNATTVFVIIRYFETKAAGTTKASRATRATSSPKAEASSASGEIQPGSSPKD